MGRKFLMALLPAVFCVFAISFGNMTPANALVVKVASVMPEGSPWAEALNRLAKEIKNKTSGEITLRIYAGGVSGDESDVLRKMRINRINAAGFTGVGLGMVVPEIRILESPLLFKNQEELNLVKNKLFKRFETEFEKKGYMLLGYVDGGEVYFFSKKKMKDANSLKNLKMWLWQNDTIANTFFHVLGIKTYPLHVADVNTGLETGMIDSFYSVPVAAVSFQWYWNIRYILDLPMVNSTGGFLINKSVFNRISQKNQVIFTTMMKRYCEELRKITLRSNIEAKQVLKDAGIKFVRPDDGQIKEFVKLANKSYEKNIPAIYSKGLLRKVKSMVALYRGRKIEKSIAISEKN